MLCVEELLKLEIFQQLPRDRLEWICDRATKIELQPKEVLVREGEPNAGFYILLSGSMSLTRFSEGIEMPLGQHHALAFMGEIPALTDEPVLVTVKALKQCLLYKITNDDFLTLIHQNRNFERAIFRVVQSRIRGLESFMQNREKMAALGTLAAGLAHELNNPAAAVVRALQDLTPAILELERMNLVYGQRNVEEEHTQQWERTREEGYGNIIKQQTDPLTLSDREAELLEWLEAYGVKDAWKLAEPLAAAAIETQRLDELMARWRDDTTELRDMGLRWLALSFEVMSMIQGGLQGAKRVSDLVQSMKSYTHLDRGARQLVDIHQGIEDTLRLFSHKLKRGVKIERDYDPNLPQIMAYGSELNQVWTNLIDNAIDAVVEAGKIEIVTVYCGDESGSIASQRIKVKFIDYGSGIPPEIQSRIFEPFFTTKSVSQGSGLGLDTVRRIVENRHRGTISLESVPGKTIFTIWLPVSNS